MRTESTDKLVKEYNDVVEAAIKKVKDYFDKYKADYVEFLSKGYEFIYEKDGYRYSSVNFPLFLKKDPDGSTEQIFYSIVDGRIFSESMEIYSFHDIVISQQFDGVIATLVSPQYYVNEYADLVTKRTKLLKKVTKLSI
ncbi:hypothetical protein [Enterococcus diestrammenae]|uniref:hypothetical protein n=1 Tax=Enterococcus diestrammenae TaxID=1155073 RepID=UPI0022E2D1AF|nr:hypothetical protein [Enterococcus diestrammenae]